MARLKLYYSDGSPFARKVRIVLAEKGLDFESDVLNALRPPEEIERLNPALSVPVLKDGETVLFESNLIVEYLLETYSANPSTDQPPPLSPWMRRPDERWRDGKTLSILETLGNSIVNTRLMVAYGGVDLGKSDYLQRQQRRIERCLDWLERAATPTGFVPGWFTVMDINFICQIGYGEAREVVELGDRPNLQALRAHFSLRKSVKETEPAPG